MDGFITSEILLSLAGCVGIVMATTQVLKKHINIPSKNIALIVSIIVGVSRIVILKRFAIDEIFVGIINILPILCGAMGAYDAMIKPKEIKTDNVIVTNIDPNNLSDVSSANELASIISDEVKKANSDYKSES